MKELKIYLKINSIFSLACGISMVVFFNELNAVFNIQNQYVFPVIGISLIAFSFFVGYVSYKYFSNRILATIISLLDALWVLGSLVIIILGLFDLSNSGYIIMGIVAAWIAFLAYKQVQNK